MVYGNGVNFTKDMFNGFLGILNFSFMIFIEGMYTAVLRSTIMIFSGFTFHPELVMLFASGWYFLAFVIIVSEENMLLQYVNSINCILRLFSGSFGGFD